MRTANAFLVKEVHVVGRRRWNRRGAMVTDRYQHVRHHEDVEACSPGRTARGSPSWASTTCPARSRSRRPGCRGHAVLLLGQEGPGLSPAARERLDLVVSIAQYGSTRSINVGAAAAIAMHTWVRQHVTGHAL